jgi:hypothetical protein
MLGRYATEFLVDGLVIDGLFEGSLAAARIRK